MTHPANHIRIGLVGYDKMYRNAGSEWQNYDKRTHCQHTLALALSSAQLAFFGCSIAIANAVNAVRLYFECKHVLII